MRKLYKAKKCCNFTFIEKRKKLITKEIMRHYQGHSFLGLTKNRVRFQSCVGKFFSKGGFFSENAMCFSNLQKKYSKKLSWTWNLNFKLRIVFWNIFFWRFGDLKKQIALSEKKPPLVTIVEFQTLASCNRHFEFKGLTNFECLHLKLHKSNSRTINIPDFDVSLLLGTVVGVADNLVGSSKLYLSGKKCNII